MIIHMLTKFISQIDANCDIGAQIDSQNPKEEEEEEGIGSAIDTRMRLVMGAPQMRHRARFWALDLPQERQSVVCLQLVP